jgi:hypothetical protein
MDDCIEHSVVQHVLEAYAGGISIIDGTSAKAGFSVEASGRRIKLTEALLKDIEEALGEVLIVVPDLVASAWPLSQAVPRLRAAWKHAVIKDATVLGLQQWCEVESIERSVSALQKRA